jgi:hypothetical protein
MFFAKTEGPMTLNKETSHKMVTCRQEIFAVVLQRNLGTVNGA